MVICIYLIMALITAYQFNCTKFGKKFKARLLQERNWSRICVIDGNYNSNIFPYVLGTCFNCFPHIQI